jgi:hypothetical protein
MPKAKTNVPYQSKSLLYLLSHGRARLNSIIVRAAELSSTCGLARRPAGCEVNHLDCRPGGERKNWRKACLARE